MRDGGKPAMAKSKTNEKPSATPVTDPEEKLQEEPAAAVTAEPEETEDAAAVETPAAPSVQTESAARTHQLAVRTTAVAGAQGGRGRSLGQVMRTRREIQRRSRRRS